MSFGYYKYIIYILSVSAVVLCLFVYYLVWKRRVLSALSPGGKGLVRGSRTKKTVREAVLILCIILAGFALLRPQWGERLREAKSEGTDVLIALDVSPSMLARDVSPDRLTRAKDAVRFLADSLGGDRIGLILFSGDAFLQCPLTGDIGAFLMFLDNASAESVSLQGTNLGRVLEEGRRVFLKKHLTTKVFVLVTDGEDHEGGAEAAAEKFRELGVSVYTLGVGGPGSELVPLAASRDESGREGEISYARDAAGNLIRSRKNTGLLQKLASLTGGEYIDISDSFSGLGRLADVLSEQKKTQFGSRIVKEKVERYQYFLLALVALLCLELLIADRQGPPLPPLLQRIKSAGKSFSLRLSLLLRARK